MSHLKLKLFIWAIAGAIRNGRQILKFSMSSLASFFTDLAAFALIGSMTAGLGETASIIASNTAARAISAGVNYNLNRWWVFEGKEGGFKTAFRYFALASLILLGNTLALNMLSQMAALSRFIAKLFVELCFFAISWSAQHYALFKRSEA